VTTLHTAVAQPQADSLHAPNTIQAGSSVQPCRVALSANVSDVLRRMNAVRELGDDELEAHIGDCARLSEKAMAEGDHDAAVTWAERMYEAIRSRSPAAIARREAEIQRQIDESVDYFAWQGKLDRQRLEGGEPNA
jgi:hypothetical protein